MFEVSLLLQICKLLTENNKGLRKISSYVCIFNKGVVQRFLHHVIDLIRYHVRNSLEKGYRHTCNGKSTTFLSVPFEKFQLKIEQLEGKQYITTAVLTSMIDNKYHYLSYILTFH